MNSTVEDQAKLNKRLERAISEAEDAADSLRDAAATLQSPERQLDEAHWRGHRALVNAAQWLIQQSFPAFHEQTPEQIDLINALEACGERAGV